MANNKQLIKTLTMEQLIQRWDNKYSLQNIYELADGGYFGLYFRHFVQKVTSCDITKCQIITELRKQFSQLTKAYPL